VTDLAILVPSRGRPRNIERLVRHCALTCRTDYVIHFGLDDDDDATEASRKAAGGWPCETGPRTGLAPWTNTLAALHMDAPYLCSVGDDMVPETDGWDEQLVAVIAKMGGGFAYPNNQRFTSTPEACVMDTRIVAALGWMALPGADHWFIDNTWADLGRDDSGREDLLACLPDVIVRHLHCNVEGGDAPDPTYWDAAKRFEADMRAYQRWRLGGKTPDGRRWGMAADRATVRAACSGPAA
jgi:hypothetical protein